MRWAVALAFAALALAPAKAQAAAPAGKERIELRYYAPVVERLEPRGDLVHPFRLNELQPSDVRGYDEPEPLDLHMPDVGPESLDLTVRYYRLELLVSADLSSSDRPFTPRVNGNANDTYFWLRASFDVTDHFTIFAESFQGANSIVPNPSVVIPPFAWDGFEWELGIKSRFGDRWTFEAGPVLYAMSATRKPSQLGTRLCLGCEF